MIINDIFSDLVSGDKIATPEKLCSEIDGFEKKLLELEEVHDCKGLVNDFMTILYNQQEDSFVQGFKIGAQITAECFVREDKQ